MQLPVHHHVVRQANNDNDDAADDDENPVLVIVAVAVAIVAVLLVLGVLTARLLLRRRRERGLALGLDPHAAHDPAAADLLATAQNGAADQQHLLLAGMAHAPPPPAVVRMQRYVQSSGLSVDELDKVAPLVNFQPAFLRVKSSISRPDGEEDDDDDPEEDADADDAPHTSDANTSLSVDDKQKKLGAAGDEIDDSTCAVCLDEMDVGDKVRCLPCGHVFHGPCIEEWVTKVNRCPVCNAHVVSEDALQKLRLGALEGRDSASSLTRLALNGNAGANGDSGATSGSAPRQRRRRARGENGVFELQHTSSTTRLSAAISGSGGSTSRSLLSGARARGAAVLGRADSSTAAVSSVQTMTSATT